MLWILYSISDAFLRNDFEAANQLLLPGFVEGKDHPGSASPVRLKCPLRGKVCHVSLNSMMAGSKHDWAIPNTPHSQIFQGSQRPFYGHFPFSNLSTCSPCVTLFWVCWTESRVPLFWSSKTAGTFVGAGHSGDHDANRSSRDARGIGLWSGKKYPKISRASYILKDGCDLKRFSVIWRGNMIFKGFEKGWDYSVFTLMETVPCISVKSPLEVLSFPSYCDDDPNWQRVGFPAWVLYAKISLKTLIFTLRVAILGYFCWHFAFPWFYAEPTPLSPWWLYIPLPKVTITTT